MDGMGMYYSGYASSGKGSMSAEKGTEDPPHFLLYGVIKPSLPSSQ